MTVTVPASTVAAARVALYAAINANAVVAADSTIHVIYDEPNPGDAMVNDIISVGDVRQQEKPYAMVGGGGTYWMQEDFVIDVTVSAFRAGDQAAVVFARAAALWDAVRTAVRTDPSLAATVVTAYPSGCEFQSSWDEKGIGRFTIALCSVTCTSQS